MHSDQVNELLSMTDHAINKLDQFKILLLNVPADKMYLFLKEYKLIISTLQKMDTLFSKQQDIYSKKDYSQQLQKNIDDDDTQFIQHSQSMKGAQQQGGYQSQDSPFQSSPNTQFKPSLGYQRLDNNQDDLFKNSQSGFKQQNNNGWNHQNSNFLQQNNSQGQDLNNQFQNSGSQIILKQDNQGFKSQTHQQQGNPQQIAVDSIDDYKQWMQQFQQQQNQFAQDQLKQNSAVSQSQIASQKQQIIQPSKNDSSIQQQQFQNPLYGPQNQTQQQQMLQQQQQIQQQQMQQQQMQQQSQSKIQQQQLLNSQQISQPLIQSQPKIQVIQKIPKQQDDQYNLNSGHPLINQQQQQQQQQMQQSKQMIQQQLDQKKQQRLQDLKNELKNQNVITVKSKKQQKQILDDLGDFLYISYKDYVNTNQNIDVCSICLSEYFQPNDYQATILQLPCQHLYHKECLEGCVQDSHFKCPNCKQVYGELIGGMPDGSMKISKSHRRCAGFQSCGTLVIFYTLPNGVYKGVHYDGTQREAYLPDNQEGQQILELLKLAFYKRITFMIGRSLTTGRDNQIVWNLHHKTSLDGGVQSFGYPDPSYFNRIRDELKEFGIE